MFIFAGTVKVKNASDTEEISINIGKRNASVEGDLPCRMEAQGLTPSRAWYLYKSVRPLVKDPQKDRLCPLPNVPEPAGRNAGEE